MAPRSKLFCPYKVIGLVSKDLPFIFDYCTFEKMYYIKVPLGNTLHVYRTSNLFLSSVSEPLSSTITCLANGSQDCSATKDGNIQIWSKGVNKLIHQWNCHQSAIHLLTVIGSTIVTVDVENNLKVSQENGDLHLDWQFSLDTFQITAMAHPLTYLNKILVGSKQGKLQLLNIKTSKVIYEFKGWNSSISVMEQAAAPLFDVLAIGLDDGRIIIHNIKLDKTIISFQQEAGRVTALSFRTDIEGRLLSGSSMGNVYVWDLNEKCLLSTVRNAHNGPILSLVCALREHMAFTSSTDNIIKSWAFDLSDGGGRQLKTREGHSEPPLHVRYHGNTGTHIISGGQDASLRRACPKTGLSFSIARAIVNKEEKRHRNCAAIKMPAITSFSTEAAREKVWDSVAAIHQNVCQVTTWSIYLSKINDRKLCHKRFDKIQYKDAMATCINTSMCGNFVFVGFSTGHIDKFNMQSGLHKLSYGDINTKHSSSVRGIVTDSLNHWLVSGDQDGVLQWWSQHKGIKDKSLDLGGGVCSMTLQRDSGLFAIALDDWSILVADVDTKSVVRKLYGHNNQITDIIFSADSKWLMSSSMDCSIRTWDLPTGSTIDHFNVPSPATSISLSPIDDYLATTHINQLGVYLWANRSCLTYVSLEPLQEGYEPPLLQLPGSTCDGSKAFDSDNEDSDLEEDILQDDFKSPDQLCDEFVTLDLMPASRWLHLAKIDQIQKRNKPEEAPKAPKSAPFFIGPTIGVAEQQIDETSDPFKSKINDTTSTILENHSVFGMLLKKGEHEAAFEKLRQMGPSNIDIEIRNLDPEVGGSRESMLAFIHMIRKVVESRVHFEVVQGYLSLFQKRHAEFMTTPDADVDEACKQLQDQLCAAFKCFKEDINDSLCLVSYFKNSAMLNY